MKTSPLAFAVALFAATAVHAQLEPSLDSNGENFKHETSNTSAHLLGEIADGTLPATGPPRPKFSLPAKDILSTSTHHLDGRKITIQKIRPLALPSPEPLAPLTPEAKVALLERLRNYRDTHPRSNLLTLSATVFRMKDSQPRTLVHYWPQGKGTTVTLWSSADFSLLSGIRSFADSQGRSFGLVMGWGFANTSRLNNHLEHEGMAANSLQIPAFPSGKATFTVVGEQLAAEDLNAIKSLHDVYNAEYERLVTAYHGREQSRMLHEAKLKVNPPKPKDIVLSYWRTEKELPSQQGGGK